MIYFYEHIEEKHLHASVASWVTFSMESHFYLKERHIKAETISSWIFGWGFLENDLSKPIALKKTADTIRCQWWKRNFQTKLQILVNLSPWALWFPDTCVLFWWHQQWCLWIFNVLCLWYFIMLLHILFILWFDVLQGNTSVVHSVNQYFPNN